MDVFCRVGRSARFVRGSLYSIYDAARALVRGPGWTGLYNAIPRLLGHRAPSQRYCFHTDVRCLCADNREMEVFTEGNFLFDWCYWTDRRDDHESRQPFYGILAAYLWFHGAGTSHVAVPRLNDRKTSMVALPHGRCLHVNDRNNSITEFTRDISTTPGQSLCSRPVITVAADGTEAAVDGTTHLLAAQNLASAHDAFSPEIV